MRYTIEARALEVLLQFRLEHHDNIWHRQHKAGTATAQAPAKSSQGAFPGESNQ